MALNHGPINIRRKFRWTAEWHVGNTMQLIAPEEFVKISSRPSLSIEETEINYLNGNKAWIPGKSSWQDMEISYTDIENSEGGSMFFHWVAQQWKGVDDTGISGPFRFDPACVILRLYDGAAKCIEQWYLDGAIVVALDFGEEVYSTGPVQTEVNVRIKYSEADSVHPNPSMWFKALPLPWEQEQEPDQMDPLVP